MQDYLPSPQPWSWPRTIMIISICSFFAWIIDDQYPRYAPVAIGLGALFDAAWYAHSRHLQVKGFRIFKVYALQEAWASSSRFRDSMNEAAFVALFEDCLRSVTWRDGFKQMIIESTVECRRDPMGNPPGIRCYWKFRYPHDWTHEQRIGALIACIGAFPSNRLWMVREVNDVLKVETELFHAAEAISDPDLLPQGAKEFWYVFQRDLSRLLDADIAFPAPVFTSGLNANVELSVPCVLPLSDGSFLHVASTDDGKLTAIAEKEGVFGSELTYADATALWEVWRHAVVVEKHNDTYIANVPEDVLTPEERAAAQARLHND